MRSTDICSCLCLVDGFALEESLTETRECIAMNAENHCCTEQVRTIQSRNLPGVDMETYLAKVDLDTIVTGYLLLRKIPSRLYMVHDCAPEEILANPSILCIECGGSGRTEELNFDHHDGSKKLPCAAEQAWHFLQQPASLQNLVQYTSAIDTGTATQGVVHRQGETLSGLISGMRYCLGSEPQRFCEGLRIIDCLVQRSVPPWDVSSLCSLDATMEHYAKTKASLRERVWALENQCHEFRIGCYRVMVLVSPYPGVHGMLRALGAAISLAGDGKRWSISFADTVSATVLETTLSLLTLKEPGWGEPVGGRILGSPREKTSTLSESAIKDILECAIVREGTLGGDKTPFSYGSAFPPPYPMNANAAALIWGYADVLFFFRSVLINPRRSSGWQSSFQPKTITEFS